MPEDWTEYRRDDGEVLGWIKPSGELWVAIDRLGRAVADPAEWLDAEAALEARGLGWLADRWLFGDDPVRIVEVTPEHVVVARDDFGAASAVGGDVERLELPWPAPPELRPLRD